MAAYQGALIREVGTGRLLHHDPLPLELAREILEFLEPEGHAVNLYIDDDLYVARRSDDVDRYERLSGMKANVVGRLSAYLTEPTTKIGVGGDPASSTRCSASLRAHFGGRVIAVQDLAVLPGDDQPDGHQGPGASRSWASASVSRRSDVLAFGDSYNDTDMLAWAGTGVAMRGRPPEVVAVADFMCEPVGRGRFRPLPHAAALVPGETAPLCSSDYDGLRVAQHPGHTAQLVQHRDVLPHLHLAVLQNRQTHYLADGVGDRDRGAAAHRTALGRGQTHPAALQAAPPGHPIVAVDQQGLHLVASERAQHVVEA